MPEEEKRLYLQVAEELGVELLPMDDEELGLLAAAIISLLVDRAKQYA